MASKVEVGKQYLTVYGDTVRIAERYLEDDDEGTPVAFYTGTFVKCRKGHENMLQPPNNVSRFTGDGRWWPKGTPRLANSIHDLKDEVK
jgi:hypothetical protein